MSINPNSDILPAHHHNQVDIAVHNAEHGMDGKLNFGALFKEINALRRADSHGGKLNSEQFKSQVQEMDQRLHHDGYLPNLHIVLDGRNKARLIPDRHGRAVRPADSHAGPNQSSRPADSHAGPDQSSRPADPHASPDQSGRTSDQSATVTGGKPVELPSASAEQSTQAHMQAGDTIGNSPAANQKEQNHLGFGAAVVKEVRQVGRDLKKVAGLAVHFAAGLGEGQSPHLGDKPLDPSSASASAPKLPQRLEHVRDTIGSSPAQHSKEQNALAIGAAVVKEASQLGLDIKTAARLAEHFVAAGLTETMTNMQDGTLDNREQGDFNHGTPTSFGFFQLHHGGEKTDDVVNGHYVKSEMSPEQAYTPNLATERAFHHFMQKHPNLNSDQSIKNCLIKAQAASDGRYERKFDCHLAQAQKLLGDSGFYSMLG